jgi:chemotaxis-related protein WspB
MLCLRFSISNDRYVIDTKEIVAVIPLLKTHKIPHTPDFVAGLISYRGQSVPVVDLNRLMGHRKSRNRLSTRIVLVNVSLRGDKQKIVGLQAEQVTEVIQIPDTAFKDSNVHNASAPYLGPVASDDEGLLQRLLIQHIIEQNLQDVLFHSLQQG